MTIQPLIGAVMLTLTTMTEALVIGAAAVTIERSTAQLSRLPLIPRMIAVITPLSLWLLFAGCGAAIWLWALLLTALNEFTVIGDAVYFASVTATTLGYGDIVLSSKWRLLSGFVAANGLLIFSLSTAFLFEAMRITISLSERGEHA